MLGKGPCAVACCIGAVVVGLLLVVAAISYMILPAAMAAHLTFGQATGPGNLTFAALPPLTFATRPTHAKAPVTIPPGPGRAETPTNGSGGTRSPNANPDPTQTWEHLEDMELNDTQAYTKATTSRPRRVLRKASAKASTGDQGKTSTGA